MYAENIAKIREELMEIHEDLHRDTKWLNLRCPFCGDSQDNPTAMHLWLGLIEETPEEPILAKCYKPGCKLNNAKPLNGEMLRQLGYHNNKMIQFIEHHNAKTATGFKGVSYNDIDYTPNYFELPISELILDREIVKYVESRTGIDYANEYKRLRLVSSLTQFKDTLDKDSVRRKGYNLLGYLASQENKGVKYIGFLTEKGDRLTVRDIHKKSYIHINLKKEEGSKNSLYKFKHPFLIDNEYKIKPIIIGEGSFDIITVYKNVKDIIGEYISIGGFSALKALLWNLTKYHFNLDIYILGESDISTKLYKGVISGLEYRINKDLGCGITLIRNTVAKDTGDIREGLKLSFTKLL